MTIDPVDLACRLIACPSVTPAQGEVFDVLEAALTGTGFTVHRFISGEAPDGPVENMVAIRGSGAPHFGFAGHLDVVPPGRGWQSDPFTPDIRGGLLYGRGAVDMKSAVACFAAAAEAVPDHGGTISLLITGDEEGPSVYGTKSIMAWMAERGIRPDMILIGEPTSEDRLGDIVKIGRRGSVNMWVTSPGVQGHVAYPHRADNPIPRLAQIAEALAALKLDDGTDAFQPSNLELTALMTGTTVTNVIPGTATVQLNVRFNTEQTGEGLVDLVRNTAHRIDPNATVEAKISGEAFLTPPGTLYDLVTSAIEAETGVAPRLTTHGGTSDGRFLIALCPVIDFGLPNATMHKLDEAASVDDIHALTRIYERILRQGLSG